MAVDEEHGSSKLILVTGVPQHFRTPVILLDMASEKFFHDGNDYLDIC
jgi:hypothetical protein